MIFKVTCNSIRSVILWLQVGEMMNFRRKHCRSQTKQMCLRTKMRLRPLLHVVALANSWHCCYIWHQQSFMLAQIIVTWKRLKSIFSLDVKKLHSHTFLSPREKNMKSLFAFVRPPDLVQELKPTKILASFLSFWNIYLNLELQLYLDWRLSFIYGFWTHFCTWEHEKIGLNELGEGIQPAGKAKPGLEMDVVSETGRLKI